MEMRSRGTWGSMDPMCVQRLILCSAPLCTAVPGLYACTVREPTRSSANRDRARGAGQVQTAGPAAAGSGLT